MKTNSKVISATYEVVSPDLAIDWLENNRYPKNRPINRSHIKLLSEAIESEQFQSGTSLHFASVNGSSYLIDGQHRLTAVKETGQAQEFSVIHHKMPDMESIAVAYSRFDRHQKRNAYDTYRAFGLDDQTGLSKTQIIRGDSAVRFIDNDFAYKSKSGYLSDFDMMDKITEYAEEIKTFFELIEGNRNKIKQHFLRRSTLAVGLVTLKFATEKYGQAKVHDFWSRCADGDMLPKNDPRLLLRDKLLTIRVTGGGQMSVAGIEQVSLLDATRFVALAWAQYCKGKSPKTLTLTSTNHYPILGTPFSVPSKHIER